MHLNYQQHIDSASRHGLTVASITYPLKKHHRLEMAPMVKPWGSANH